MTPDLQKFIETAPAIEVLAKCAISQKHGIVAIGSPMFAEHVASDQPRMTQGWVVGLIGNPANFEAESAELDTAIRAFALEVFK